VEAALPGVSIEDGSMEAAPPVVPVEDPSVEATAVEDAAASRTRSTASRYDYHVAVNRWRRWKEQILAGRPPPIAGATMQAPDGAGTMSEGRAAHSRCERLRWFVDAAHP
jgi:hypothetical protein